MGLRRDREGLHIILIEQCVRSCDWRSVFQSHVYRGSYENREPADWDQPKRQERGFEELFHWVRSPEFSQRQRYYKL